MKRVIKIPLVLSPQPEGDTQLPANPLQDSEGNLIWFEGLVSAP